jgi:acyl phosphate:glycerol-3-phosphate acyltransferase
MQLSIFILIAYILGSIPVALVVGKIFFNIDIRNHGSGNLGGTNAGRVLGKKAGLAVSVLDVLKVFTPALIARLYLGVDSAAIIGMFGMLGHCYPVFAGFKGGKGVSSFIGIIFALNFIVGIIIVAIWKILKHTTNYVSVASILTCFSASFIFLYIYKAGLAFYSLFLGALFIVYLHRSNISRLLKGAENKVKDK